MILTGSLRRSERAIHCRIVEIQFSLGFSFCNSTSSTRNYPSLDLKKEKFGLYSSSRSDTVFAREFVRINSVFISYFRSLLAGHSAVVVVPPHYSKRNLMQLKEANASTFLKRFLATCRYYVHNFELTRYFTKQSCRRRLVYRNALEGFKP